MFYIKNIYSREGDSKTYLVMYFNQGQLRYKVRPSCFYQNLYLLLLLMELIMRIHWPLKSSPAYKNTILKIVFQGSFHFSIFYLFIFLSPDLIGLVL